MTTSITAKTKKTATAVVGTIWEVGVKVAPAPSDDVDRPVTVAVDTPSRGIRTVVATPTGDGGYAAAFVLDEAGDFTATVHVVSEDGAEPDTLDGFTATATPLPETDPANEPSPEPGTTDASDPGTPGPADA